MKLFDKPENKENLALFGQFTKGQHGRCWAPGLDCMGVPIRAHSVQNAIVLQAIQSKGHVIGIETFLKGGELHGGFRKIGRNKATTFRGLCSEHDNKIFATLDAGNLDLTDKMTCALLTWRAITHEMAAKMDVGWKFQAQYNAKIESGEIDKNTPDPLGMEAVLWMKVLYDFYNYREENLTPYIFSKQPSKMLYKNFIIKNTGPIIASSSFFVVKTKANGEPSHTAVNIFPYGDDTHILFSICRTELGQVMPIIRSLHYKGLICPVKLSAFLLSRVQNFVIAPNHFFAWNQDKISLIVRAFLETVTNESFIPPDNGINLFQ